MAQSAERQAVGLSRNFNSLVALAKREMKVQVGVEAQGAMQNGGLLPS